MKADPEYSIKHYASIRDVPENVRRLFEVAGEKDFFLSADWFTLFEEQIPGPDDRLYYYVASDEGGEPVVALPLMHAAGRGRILTALTNFYSLSYGPVTATSGKALETALTSLFHHILAERPAWTSIRLEPIIGKGDLPELIARAAKKAGGFIATEQMSENWIEPINGRSADEYLADRPGRVRSTLKRKRRALEREHEATLTIIDSDEGLDAAIHDYLQIYEKSWKTDESYPRFIPKLMAQCSADGRLRLATLTIDGAPAASQFWIVHGELAIIYKLSYDPAFSDFSPGSLLTEALARHCIEEGNVATIDFGLGGDEFKRDWMSNCQTAHNVAVINQKSLHGRLKVAGTALSQLIPYTSDQAKNALQGWRRKSGYSYSATTSETGPDGTPTARRIPMPAVPVFPIISWGTIKEALSKRTIPKSDYVGDFAFTRNGREAILLALKCANIGKGDKVLVPAYHCEAMISPITQLGAIPVYYDLDEALQPSTEHISSLIDDKTRALLFVHYFGFVCRTEELLPLALKHNLVLLEDCAHVGWGAQNIHHLGQVGDYKIYSLRKFFPINEGGLLVTRKSEQLSPNLPPQTNKLIRQIASACARAGSYGRLSPLGYLALWLSRASDTMGRHRVSAQNAAVADLRKIGSSLAEAILPADLNSSDKFIATHSSPDKAAQLRQHNYGLLISLIGSCEECEPLWKTLPTDTVPFMVPLIIKNLEQVFPAFEEAGIPMQRFGQFISDRVSQEEFPQSIEFSKTLILLPCHPDLRKSEIIWIADKVRGILAASPCKPEKAPSQSSPNLRVEAFEDISRLPSSVVAFFQSNPSLEFYDSLEWYRSLQLSLPANEILVTVVIFHECNPVGVFFLKKYVSAWQKLINTRNLSSAVSVYSVRYAPLLSPQTSETTAIMECFAGALASGSLKCNRLRIDLLDPDAKITKSLETALKNQKFSVSRFFNFVNWHEEIGEISSEEFFAARTSKFRSEIRRRIARIEESLGPLEFDIFSSEPEMSSALQKFQEVYKKSWKKHESSPDFIVRIVGEATKIGCCRIGLLRIGGKVIAAKLAFLSNGVFAMYKTAYDPEYRKFAPGTLINFKMIERILQKETVREIDFGIGDEKYKSLWVGQRRERWGLIANNKRTLIGKLNIMVDRIRSVTKSVLSSDS